MKKVLAFDIGGTYSRAGIVSETGQVLGVVKRETEKKQASFIKSLVKLADNLEYQDVDGVAVSIAGFLDGSKLRCSPNLPFKNLAVIAPLKKNFGKEVVLVNDANAGAVGEKTWGAAKNVSNFIYLTISSGIGGAAYMKDKLVLDKKGNGIEPGHIDIESDFELPCGCGGKNHWESYASGRNMPKYLEQWAERENIFLEFPANNVYEIFQAVNLGNQTAFNFVAQTLAIDEKGINILYSRYKPEMILIGGGVYLTNRAIFDKFFTEKFAGKVVTKSATFGDNASLVGAAASYFQKK
jgi:glucokinase